MGRETARLAVLGLSVHRVWGQGKLGMEITAQFVFWEMQSTVCLLWFYAGFSLKNNSSSQPHQGTCLLPTAFEQKQDAGSLQWISCDSNLPPAVAVVAPSGHHQWEQSLGAPVGACLHVSVGSPTTGWRLSV